MTLLRNTYKWCGEMNITLVSDDVPTIYYHVTNHSPNLIISNYTHYSLCVSHPWSAELFQTYIGSDNMHHCRAKDLGEHWKRAWISVYSFENYNNSTLKIVLTSSEKMDIREHCHIKFRTLLNLNFRKTTYVLVLSMHYLETLMQEHDVTWQNNI